MSGRGLRTTLSAKAAAGAEGTTKSDRGRVDEIESFELGTPDRPGFTIVPHWCTNVGLSFSAARNVGPTRAASKYVVDVDEL